MLNGMKYVSDITNKVLENKSATFFGCFNTGFTLAEIYEPHPKKT